MIRWILVLVSCPLIMISNTTMVSLTIVSSFTEFKYTPIRFPTMKLHLPPKVEDPIGINTTNLELMRFHFQCSDGSESLKNIKQERRQTSCNWSWKRKSRQWENPDDEERLAELVKRHRNDTKANNTLIQSFKDQLRHVQLIYDSYVKTKDPREKDADTSTSTTNLLLKSHDEVKKILSHQMEHSIELQRNNYQFIQEAINVGQFRWIPKEKEERILRPPPQKQHQQQSQQQQEYNLTNTTQTSMQRHAGETKPSIQWQMGINWVSILWKQRLRLGDRHMLQEEIYINSHQQQPPLSNQRWTEHNNNWVSLLLNRIFGIRLKRQKKVAYKHMEKELQTLKTIMRKDKLAIVRYKRYVVELEEFIRQQKDLIHKYSEERKSLNSLGSLLAGVMVDKIRIGNDGMSAAKKMGRLKKDSAKYNSHEKNHDLAALVMEERVEESSLDGMVLDQITEDYEDDNNDVFDTTVVDNDDSDGFLASFSRALWHYVLYE